MPKKKNGKVSRPGLYKRNLKRANKYPTSMLFNFLFAYLLLFGHLASVGKCHQMRPREIVIC